MKAAFKLHQQMIDEAEKLAAENPGKVFHVVAAPGSYSHFITAFNVIESEKLSSMQHSFYNTEEKEWHGKSISNFNGKHSSPFRR